MPSRNGSISGEVVALAEASDRVLEKERRRLARSIEDLRGRTEIHREMLESMEEQLAREERLLRVLSAYPNCFGIGVDEDTAAIIRGNTLTVVGNSSVSICVTPSTAQGQWRRLKAGDTFDLQPLRASLQPSATAAGGGK